LDVEPAQTQSCLRLGWFAFQMKNSVSKFQMKNSFIGDLICFNDS
jgi:hypothetical protein